MVAIKLQNFGGMIPAVDDQLLPQNSAAYAQDVWVNSGAIEGFRQARLIYTPTNATVSKVYRIPMDAPDASRILDSYWLEFDTPFADVIQAPTLNDAFERFYWATNISPPQYNTKQRIVDGDPPLLLGVPAPDVEPGVSVTGGSTPTETRAYVYTWVTAFGEEGPPSPPQLFTGNSDGTWSITLTAPGLSETTDRLLENVRIYRTVSGVGGETDYFFVHEQPIGDLTFDDTVASVTNNRLLETIFWTLPPSDLQGFVSMPNGIVASWRENEVWFCQPYRPHAWPVIYQVAVDSTIVGCGVIGQTLIVCTEGAPYAISGINPASMAISRLATFEPCMSRGSIVSTPSGVVYASPNGLVAAVPGSAVVLTKQLIPKEKWSELLQIDTLFGATYNGGYYAFGSVGIGCFSPEGFNTEAFLQLDVTGAFTGGYLDINDPRVSYSVLTSPVPVREVHNDPWTGEVFIHRDDGVYWIDTSVTRPLMPYTWRSKIMETPNARNFQAMRVYFSTLPVTPELNPVQDFSPEQTLQPNQWGLIRLYANGRLVFTRELRRSGDLFRLPSGFKATFWQVEIEARVRINSVEMATTAVELASV